MSSDRKPLQGHWADYPSRALQDLPDDLIAILPLGATEQHGPHLPLSVDTDLTMAVIEAALPHLGPRQNVLVLPPLSVTKSDEHGGFPGTLSLSAETLLAVLRDLSEGMAGAGVRRCLLLNGHGGNAPVIEIAAREMRVRCGMITCTASWFGFADTESGYAPDDLRWDIHGGDLETSAMLAIKPELVEMARARAFVSQQEAWSQHHPGIGLGQAPVRPGWRIEDLNPEGAVGRADLATAAKGQALIESAGRNLAGFLAAFATFNPSEAQP